MTTAVIKLDGSDDELRSLAKWLREEDILRGRIELVDEPARPGQMGGVLAAVAVVITSGTATAMVTSLFDWLQHKRESAKVSIVIRKGEGEPGLEVTCGSADDIQVTLDAIHRFLDGS